MIDAWEPERRVRGAGVASSGWELCKSPLLGGLGGCGGCCVCTAAALGSLHSANVSLGLSWMHPELSEQDKPNGQEGAKGSQSAAIKANFWGRGTPDGGTPHPEVSPVAKATASNCLCLPGRVPGTSSPLSGSPMARHRGRRSRAGPLGGRTGLRGGEHSASKMQGNGLEAGLKEPAGQIHVRQRCQPGHVLSWQSHGPASLAWGVCSCCSLPASPAPPCPAPRGCGFPRESGSVPGSREGASTRAARSHCTPMGWGGAQPHSALRSASLFPLLLNPSLPSQGSQRCTHGTGVAWPKAAPGGAASAP